MTIPSGWEDLHDIAARFMSPDDIVDGKKKLIEIARTAKTRIAIIKFILLISQLLLLMTAAATALVVLRHSTARQPFNEHILYINPVYAFFSAIAAIFAVLYLPNCIQFHPRLIPWLRLPERCHPPELVPLLDGLRSGAWKARAKRGILPNYIYDSEWNILLFSGAEHKSERGWLRRWSQVAYDGDIEAYRVDGKVLQPDPLPLVATSDIRAKPRSSQQHDKPPARSERRRRTHWLLAIPATRFETFLEAAAKAREWEHWDAPRKVRIVLVAAQRSAQWQLEQTGGISLADMRRACVSEIKERLKGEPDAFIGLSGKQGERSKNSDSWIELLLRTKGNAEYSEIRQRAEEFTRGTSEAIGSDT